MIWVGEEFSGYGTLVAILACAAIVDLLSYPAAAVLQSLERAMVPSPGWQLEAL